MKIVALALIGGILFFSGCGQSPFSPGYTPSSVPGTAASTPASTQTATPIPTDTQTPTITPLPPIPTFTPTFDVSTIVTVTPAPEAECPQPDAAVVAEFATPNTAGNYVFFSANDVLAYLNSGGALDPFVSGPVGSSSDSILGTIVDLTGDGVSELIVRGLVRYDILGCKRGKYENLYELATYDFTIDLEDIVDLNEDSTPEVILYSFTRYGYADIYIIGWDGNRFRSLIDSGTDVVRGQVIDSVPATSPHKLMDLNGDGLGEIVVLDDVKELCGGFGGFCDGTPARAQTTILGWNGRNYVIRHRYYAPAEFRFQAVQDADLAVMQLEYAKALSLHQAAISSDKLKGYSREIRDNLRAQWDSQFRTTPSPTPYPNPSDEYSRLAAYAYYRIMLIHLVQNLESDAIKVYNTLQQEFGGDPYGRPYVEMATAFWNAYQSTHRMYDGCAAAIQYAVQNPEILIPLGSDYHGWQSHIYVPADVCPFR